jgi:hypothetical protein
MFIGGKIEGRARARSVFPEPGGPLMIRSETKHLLCVERPLPLNRLFALNRYGPQITRGTAGEALADQKRKIPHDAVLVSKVGK